MTDYILAVRQSNGSTERDYVSHKVTHDSDESLEDHNFSGPVRETDSGILVADETTLSEVEGVLTNADVAFDTATAGPTSQQQRILKREDVTNDREAGRVLAERAELVDRNLVSQDSQYDLAMAIDNVDDPDAREALEAVFEVLTGKKVSEL